jgi:polyisoprenyl-phosphate glycosyltransferase
MANRLSAEGQKGPPHSTLTWPEDGETLRAIPTTDPAEALRFCQALAHALDPRHAPFSNRKSQTAFALTPEEHPHTTSQPDLSVVIPVHNEQENLPVLYDRLTQVLQQHSDITYELLFIDDGSSDNSINVLRRFAQEDARVIVVELARNFGHQAAISAGLDHSTGRAVTIMDADLQDPPELLPEFLTKWQEGYEVVYAIREQRKESWPRRLAYAAFYRLLRSVASITIPVDAGDFCLMDRRVVEWLVRMPERQRFLRGLRSWVGFSQVGIPYKRQARYAGQPQYTTPQLFQLALDGITAFSNLPLRTISILGLAVSLFSIILAIFYAMKKLMAGLTPPGFTTEIVAIFFLAGVQLLTIGVIGEYVGHIAEEVKRRPLYITRRVIRRNDLRGS